MLHLALLYAWASRFLDWRSLAISRACTLVVVLFVGHAFADSSVLLVVKGAPDQDTAPYELRLRSEFAAEGLEVVTASGRSQQNILDLEGLARRTGAVAAISVYVDAQDVQGRLWVSDPNSNADLVRTLHVSRVEGDSVSVFALRAVEALRGARLELEQQRRRMAGTGGTSGEPTAAAPPVAAGATPAASAPTAKPVSAPPRQNPKLEEPKPQRKIETTAHEGRSEPARAPRTNRWTVVLGGSAGVDENGIGLMASPFLGVRYGVWQRLSLAVSLEGPFPRRKSNDSGVVQIDQEIAELQARLRLASTRWITLDGVVATGASRFATTAAETTVPGTASSAQSIGWVFGAGAGSQFVLTGHWVLDLDLDWLRRLPAPVIYAGGLRLTGPTDALILAKLGIGVVF